MLKSRNHVKQVVKLITTNNFVIDAPRCFENEVYCTINETFMLKV